MPLHDHFRPPWNVQRPWEGFQGAWASAMAFHLNSGILPADYFAIPLLQVGGRVEVDVGTFHQEEQLTGTSGTATAVWAPPQPALTLPLEVAETDTFEVQVLRNYGGPQLRAAIELVSPSNKDRAGSRRAFAGKCAGYLRKGLSVIVIDMVTERTANLHAEILTALERSQEPPWTSPTHLYAVAYRSVLTPQQQRLEIWPETLTVGAPLPSLPLWLGIDLCVPLNLEESYVVTCRSLRMPR